MATSQDTRVKIVDIQVKYQEAVDAMAKYRAAIDEARAQLKALKKDLKDGKISQEEYNAQSEASRVFMKQQGDAINTLGRQVQNQIRVQKENEGSLKQLRAELSNATAAYDAMSRAERDSAKGQELKNHIVQITNELKSAEESTMRFYRNVGNYPSSATSGLDTIKGKITDLGKAALSAIGASSFLSFSSNVLQVTRDFDDAMARVKAVTNATTEEMQMMEDEARKMGRETIYHATDAAKAMETLSRGGFTAQEATTALSQTLKLAQANTIDLDESADMIIRTIRGFKLPVTAEELEHVSDVLSKAGASSATNISEMGEAFKNVSPFASALGIPIEQVAASLGVLADRGVRASDAGTAMRMVLLGLAQPTSNAGKVFQKYGINISQAEIQTRGLAGVLDELNKSGIMKSKESMNELSAIFGRKAVGNVVSLIGSLDDYQQKLETVSKSQGETERMFEQSYSSVSVAIATLSSAWESFEIALGKSNSDLLIGPIQAMTKIVRFVESNLELIQRLVMAVIAGITFTKLISSARTAFTQIRNSAVTNAEAATQKLQVCQNNEIALRKQTASLTKQLESANAVERERIEAQLVAKKRELANAEKLTQKAKTTEITMWERASAMETGNAWTRAWTVAKIGVTGFVASAKAAFRGFIVTAILSLVFELVMKLYDKLNEGQGIWANLKNWATSACRTAANWFIALANGAIDLYNNIAPIRLIVQYIALQFKSLWEVVKLVFNLIIDAAKSVGRQLSGIGQIIKGVVTFSWDDIKAGAKALVGNFSTTIKEAWGDMKTFGRNMANNVLDAYNKTLTQGTVAHIKPIVEEPAPATKSKGEGNGKNSNKENTNSNSQTESNTETPDTSNRGSGGSSSGKKKSSTASKEERARAKAAQEEAKLVADAEKAMLDLLGECNEKKKAMLENQYNGEINKLKAKLATDKTLTEKSKDAIRQTIIAKEQKLQQELDKLDDDHTKTSIENQQKLIESKLSVIRKGSQEELNLKLEQNRNKTNLDILALKQEEEAAQKGAATALMYRQQTLNELEASGTATEEQLTQAKEAVAYAQSEITRINEDYAERRTNRMVQSFQTEDQLRQAHDQAVLDQQILALQNELTEVEMFKDQELNAINDDWNSKQTLEQYLQENNLEVVTDFEMRKMQIQQEMAEARLQFILDQGQLETETEEQYNSRVINAKKSVADAKQAINKASLKNEQAYSKAMASVGEGIISVIDAIGESDKNFAKLSKIITLAKIAIDTGKAISAGVANAMELPYPANLAAAATTVATVLANIATAISTVKSANFAEGGKVHGPGTGTSDSVPANLSNGEFVMTAKATKLFEPLLTVMNSIGAGVPISTRSAYEKAENAESLTDSFTQAAQEIKPVVSVVEITEAQDRVKVIENLDNF